MSVKASFMRLAVVGSLTVMASTGLMTGTASAATERSCNTYFCNSTVGTGTYVQYVDAIRQQKLLGKYGFFEVFGPLGFKLTGVTTTANSNRFPIRKSFESGQICLRFFEMVAGQAKEQGTAACTSIPIG